MKEGPVVDVVSNGNFFADVYGWGGILALCDMGTSHAVQASPPRAALSGVGVRFCFAAAFNKYGS